jgi:hypothetical protein
MLVRDAGDAWQIVLQTDHGRLAGDFARAWRPVPERMRSLEVVADRHDDGWFVWEQEPGLDERGRPCGYLDVEVRSHIAFYRAAITAITEQDPFAGLIVSMHGAGIYQSRYGLQPSLRMSLAGRARELVDEFVAEEERSHPERAAALGLGEQERWDAYRHLQAWDQLSLYACLNDLDAEAGDDGDAPYSSIPAAPREDGEATLRLRARAARRVEVDPFPFGDGSVSFSLVRRMVPKREWADADVFRADFHAAEPERLSFEMGPAR